MFIENEIKILNQMIKSVNLFLQNVFNASGAELFFLLMIYGVR